MLSSSARKDRRGAAVAGWTPLACAVQEVTVEDHNCAFWAYSAWMKDSAAAAIPLTVMGPRLHPVSVYASNSQSNEPCSQHAFPEIQPKFYHFLHPPSCVSLSYIYWKHPNGRLSLSPHLLLWHVIEHLLGLFPVVVGEGLQGPFWGSLE